MGEGWRTFDHTGDLGLEVWAETPERLYGLAAEALIALMIEAPEAPREVEARVSLTGEDPADLLVHWLNTALLESELRRTVWTAARIETLTAGSLEATLAGPRRDPSRQIALREIKAVSHHGLELFLEPPECRCRLVLDL